MNKREAQHISKQIAEILMNIRIERHISKRQMEKETNLSRTSILNIEKKEQHPALYTLLIFANYLQVNLADLLIQVEAENNENIKELLHIIRLLREKDLQALQETRKFIEQLKVK